MMEQTFMLNNVKSGWLKNLKKKSKGSGLIYSRESAMKFFKTIMQFIKRSTFSIFDLQHYKYIFLKKRKINFSKVISFTMHPESRVHFRKKSKCNLFFLSKLINALVAFNKIVSLFSISTT